MKTLTRITGIVLGRRSPGWLTTEQFALLGALTIGLLLAGCSGSKPTTLGTGDQGEGPQILTSDLVQRQEVKVDRLMVNWAIVGDSPIRSVLIDGEPEEIVPADTLTISREVVLRKSQTLLSIAATDARGEKRVRTYMLVNPALPERDPDEIAIPATKLPVGKAAQDKAAREVKREESVYRAKFSESDYSHWEFEGPLEQSFKDLITAGKYPLWIEGRSLGVSFRPQYRYVAKPLPKDFAAYKVRFGLTAGAYNKLMDEFAAEGYEQLFREVLMASNDQWRVQTVWRLKAAKQ
jgi:hypothetical protein